MKHGLINKMAVTPANVPDARVLRNICPNGGMVLGDKGYSTKAADNVLLANGCHNGIIRKNNDTDKDRWLSGLRAPYEGTFSKMSRRTRYRGIAKVQFQAAFEALAFNIKRLVKMNAPPDLVGA